MQIEQVIGGVNGDTTAQAVQLRMRTTGQNLVANAKLVVVDAAGANPIVLKDMTTNVTNSTLGTRILLATPSFATYTDVPLVKDFEMAAIPASYLAAGQLRFMDNASSIYWSLSWGGDGYTGSTTGVAGTGAIGNDSNGIFGPPVNVALPSTTLQALQFTGANNALSTTNLAQYAVTVGAATFVNNAGTSFIVTTPPPPPEVLLGDYNDDLVVDALDYTVWQNNFGTNFDLAGNGDEDGASANFVDEADFDLWKLHYGDVPDPPGAGGSAIPEPGSWATLASVLLFATRRRRT